MTDFHESEEAVPPMGEQSIESGGTDNPNPVLARAKARRPTPDEIEEAAARRKRNAAIEAMPDLATLQTRWVTGGQVSDGELAEMRRLEAMARIEKQRRPNPVTPVTGNSPAASRLDDARLMDQARQHELEMKLKTGGKWSDRERAEWWLLHSLEIGDKSDRLVRKGRIGDAVFLILLELAKTAVAQSRARDKLEDRIAALEPKPRVRVRVRVPAGREVIT